MKTTEELAREAGDEMMCDDVLSLLGEEVERFRQLVRNEALEEAAAKCIAMREWYYYGDGARESPLDLGLRCERAIRALKT